MACVNVVRYENRLKKKNNQLTFKSLDFTKLRSFKCWATTTTKQLTIIYSFFFLLLFSHLIERSCAYEARNVERKRVAACYLNIIMSLLAAYRTTNFQTIIFPNWFACFLCFFASLWPTARETHSFIYINIFFFSIKNRFLSVIFVCRSCVVCNVFCIAIALSPE